MCTMVPCSVENVFFSGEEMQRVWDKNNLTNYFFHHPSQETKMLCLRVAKDVPMNHIKNWVMVQLALQGITLYNIILSYMGRVVGNCERMKGFPALSLFLVFEETVPQAYANHRGKLIQCEECKDKVNMTSLNLFDSI